MKCVRAILMRMWLVRGEPGKNGVLASDRPCVGDEVTRQAEKSRALVQSLHFLSADKLPPPYPAIESIPGTVGGGWAS